jgi:hypothetical protein
LEPSGWGTRVTLTAESPEPVPEPVAQPQRRGFWARLFRRAQPVVVEPEPPAFDGERVLSGALDALGAAHHRPFSR